MPVSWWLSDMAMHIFWWCVSCSAADRLRFCSFSGERIYIILALIFFLPKQRAVRVVICLLHICSIVCTICPAVFLYVFIFNFQILSNADISSLAQISQCLGVHGVSYGQQKPSISFLMTERKHFEGNQAAWKRLLLKEAIFRLSLNPRYLNF